MRRLLFAILILCPMLARGQKLVAPADIPAVEALIASPLKPLKCFTVSRSSTVNDGLRVEAAYNTIIPLDQYPQDAAPKWTSIVRVEPDEDPGSAVYLTDSFTQDSENANIDDYVAGPEDDSGIRGLVLRYRGHFWTGRGSFVVYWIVLDDQGRSCRTKWKFTASSAAGRLKLAIPEGAVVEASVRGLAQGAGQRRPTPDVRPLTVLLDVPPPRNGTSSFLGLFPKGADTLRLLAELSDLVRRIPANSIRLVCFSLERQRVVYRDDDFHDSLDSLQRLDDAISGVNFDTVNYRVLKNRQGHLALLAQLINAEISASPPSAAVVFMGSQERFRDKLPPGALKARASQPKFFDLQPGLFHDDSVSLAVKAVKGIHLQNTSSGDLNRAIERINESMVGKAH